MTSDQTRPKKFRRFPRGPRNIRKNTRKANTQGIYQRAIKEAFVKLNPRIMIKNPVMFLVWVGTIITALLTINPDLFGNATGTNPRLINSLITIILLATLLFLFNHSGKFSRIYAILADNSDT